MAVDRETVPSAKSEIRNTGAKNTGRLVFLLPISVFALLAIAFAIGLTLNPGEIPSALIGKPVPEFDLPAVKGRTRGFPVKTRGLSSENLKGEVSLVNVFASWCTECRVEHPFFMDLRARDVVPVHGLNYKDKPEDARHWLDSLGDPYTRTGADLDGRVVIARIRRYLEGPTGPRQEAAEREKRAS